MREEKPSINLYYSSCIHSLKFYLIFLPKFLTYFKFIYKLLEGLVRASSSSVCLVDSWRVVPSKERISKSIRSFRQSPSHLGGILTTDMTFSWCLPNGQEVGNAHSSCAVLFLPVGPGGVL